MFQVLIMLTHTHTFSLSLSLSLILLTHERLEGVAGRVACDEAASESLAATRLQQLLQAAVLKKGGENMFWKAFRKLLKLESKLQV